MCKFCTDKKKAERLFDSENDNSILIEGDRAYIGNIYSEDEDDLPYFEINYCPMCGKKLEAI
jgi:hypothetical protein